MTEALLHFIWQHQHFSKNQVLTVAGEPLHILNAGLYNTNAGADFSGAIVQIGDIRWSGCVEIHKKSSDWNAHKHTQDAAYNNVILHVVWQHDHDVLRQDGTVIPTLELQSRVSEAWLQKCQQLMDAPHSPIPCASQLSQIEPIHLRSALDHALMQRVESKAEKVLEWLQQNGNDWEETTYWLLMQNMGFKTNAEPMLALAQNLPLKYLRKHGNQRLLLESLFFGAGGWLRSAMPDDSYQILLKKEYDYLAHKYELQNKTLEASYWKFLRMRPANFPTVRLAQMAAIVQQNPHLFSLLLECTTAAELKAFLRVPVSEYWQTHYNFGKASSKPVPQLGDESLNNIMLNTAVPLLVAYGRYHEQPQWIEKAIGWLENLPAEKNNITALWEDATKTKLLNAADSQASIEQYKQFCLPKKCLQCQIGYRLLRQ
jgi:hypothetical protein